MSLRPHVSIITGTIPERVDLVVEAMHNLRQQSYPNIEHCIAVEGGRSQTIDTVTRIRLEAVAMPHHVNTNVVPLGRWWSRFLAASISTVPFQVAQWMASGDYLMWLADDERMTPDHVESLVDLLETTDSDFVYPRVELWTPDGFEMTVGNDPPMLGAFTHALFRVELLDYRGFTTHVGSATDWDQAKHWIEAGARWAMLDRVTLRHRMDKFGEGPDYRTERQPLRGHRERVSA